MLEIARIENFNDRNARDRCFSRSVSTLHSTFSNELSLQLHYKLWKSTFFGGINVYEIHKCVNATRQPDEPICASDEEIEEWLVNKYAQFRFINQKIDFNDRGEYAVRLNEIWLPTMPL